MLQGFKYILLTLAAFFLLLPLIAQERLVGLSENPHARPQPPQLKKRLQRNAPAMLQLPFVDNFVPENPWPNMNLWTDNGVYINTNYAVNMPTLGVATFDALGSDGRLHTWLGGASMPSDTLTSLPIDLSISSGVVLSFFYQAGGLADMPGPNDLLRLEFYSPADDEWTTVWTASANSADSSIIELSIGGGFVKHQFDTISTQFIYTAREVGDHWLQQGFQFRFINHVSLTVNNDALGRANNGDFWHLSFVYMDKNRNVDDTRLPDVGICTPQGPVTLGYESIPAYHLNTTEAQRNLFPSNTQFTISYRNLGWGTKQVTSRFAIHPLYGSTTPAATYTGGTENIFDYQTQTRTFDSFQPYQYTADGDDAAFEVRSYLVVDADNTPLRTALRKNDTTSYIQRFSDYYAYDDGSAENGYGLFGYGTDNGRVAVQFQTYRTDSLRGMYMYFNFAKDSANLKKIQLAVWADNDEKPGALMYAQSIDRPVLRDSINAYVAYKFLKPIPISRGQKFYIGWIQTTEAFLNVGYDANRTTGGKNYYALNGFGEWFFSLYDGALMMRPIFCRPGAFPDDAVELPANKPVTVEGDNYLLYPNPARDLVSIRNLTAEEQMLPQADRQSVEVYDLRGEFLFAVNTPNGSFSVGDLPAGVYIVRVIENNKIKTSKRIIIAR